MRTLLIIIVACVFLAGCGKPSNTAERAIQERLDAGDVALVAIAPDGTHLWAVYDRGRTVYFAASAAQWTERHGKTSETIQVPSTRQ